MPDRSAPSPSPLILPALVTVVLAFAALARGAHDLWSATAVHLSVLGLAVAWAWAAYRSGRPLRFPAWPAALALLAAWIAAATAAGNRADAIFAVKDLIAALLLFYMGANFTDDQRSWRAVLGGMAAVLVVQAVLAVIQIGTDNAKWNGEAAGALINANVQAGFVLFWVPPLAFGWRSDRGTGFGWVWTAGLAASAVLLLATGSVAAALCLVVPGLLAAALSTRRAGFRAGLLAAAVLTAAGLVWYKMRAVSGQVGGWLPPRTELDRLDWWRTGWEMFRHRPWFGVGPGGYPSAFSAFKVGAGQSTRFAHSLPVTLLAETGLAGAVAALLAVALWLRGLYASGSVSRLPQALGAALFLAFAAFSLGGEYLVNQLALAFLLGLVSADAPAAAWRPRFAHVLLLGGLALLSVPWTVSPFLASRLVVAAQDDLASGRAADAATHAAAAIDLDATQSDAWAARAEAQWKLGRADDAIDSMDRAGRLNGYDADLIVRKAKMLAGAGRSEEAEKEAERAYLLNPRLFAAPRN